MVQILVYEASNLFKDFDQAFFYMVFRNENDGLIVAIEEEARNS